jgi:hypothetical protein
VKLFGAGKTGEQAKSVAEMLLMQLIYRYGAKIQRHSDLIGIASRKLVKIIVEHAMQAR